MQLQKEFNQISAANDGLILPDGCRLTLITDNGEIIQQGAELNASLFEAMKKQVVQQVFSTVKPLSKQ